MWGKGVWLAIGLAAVLATGGCRKDKPGAATLSVQTTLPEGVEITLVSVDRPGNYVERVKSTLGGYLNYTGVKPGKYTLVYQFVQADRTPTAVPYNYGESKVVEVKPGRNAYEWSVDTGAVTRKDG